MIEIKSPNKIPETKDLKIFLAGSIEMGVAENWQERVTKELGDEPVVLLNPRRENWDPSWPQSKGFPKFREQVEWELNALETSDYTIMYFDPKTKSPISLLELGLHARNGKLLVVCSEEFWRSGNVDIVCEKYKIPRFESLESLLEHTRKVIK